MTSVAYRTLTLISFNFESLLFLKSFISFSRRLHSAAAAFCFSLACAIISLNSERACLAAATSLIIYRQFKAVD